MSPDQPKDWGRGALMLSQDILDSDMVMDMDMDLEVSALESVFTQQAQSKSPDQHRVLAREVLMLSQATTHRTTGHQLLLLMATPPAMDVVASVAPSQDTLVLVMDMVMD